MLDKEKKICIKEANLNQWKDGIKKAVKQVGGK